MLNFTFNHNFNGLTEEGKRIYTIKVYNETGVVHSITLNNAIRTVNGIGAYRRETIPAFFLGVCERKMKENFKGTETYYLFKRAKYHTDDDVTHVYMHVSKCKLKIGKEYQTNFGNDQYEYLRYVTIYDDKGQKFTFDTHVRYENTPEKDQQEAEIKAAFDALNYDERDRNDHGARSLMCDILKHFTLTPKATTSKKARK